MGRGWSVELSWEGPAPYSSGGPRPWLFCGAESPPPTPLTLLCLQEWLSRFGYLPPADPETGQLQTPEELSKAIVAMQRFGGLEATGVLGQSLGCGGRWVPTWFLPSTPEACLAVLGQGGGFLLPGGPPSSLSPPHHHPQCEHSSG